MEIKDIQKALHHQYFRDEKKAEFIKISPKEFYDLMDCKGIQQHIGFLRDKDGIIISHTFDGLPLIITDEIKKFSVS